MTIPVFLGMYASLIVLTCLRSCQTANSPSLGTRLQQRSPAGEAMEKVSRFTFSADVVHNDSATYTTAMMMASWDLRNRSRGGYENNQVTELIDRLLTGYDVKARPPGPPTKEYSLDCYFRQSWRDSRLSYGEFSNISAALLPLGVTVLQKIWKPDTTVYNGKHSYFHDITGPNKFIRIYRDGTLVYSQRLTLRARCPMQLQKYPMDTQRCPLDLGSFAYTTRDVEYVWKNGNKHAVVLAEDLKLSQFNLLAADGSSKNMTTVFGSYSVLSVEFILQRHSGYFLIQIYLPCMLIVVLSWVQFWLNREASGDRITLGVTCILTMTFLGIDTRSSGDYPRVSYMTALDLFVSMSFFYIFFSIVLYAFVHINTKYGTGDSYHQRRIEQLSYDTPERRSRLRAKFTRSLSKPHLRRRFSAVNYSRSEELHLGEANYVKDQNGGVVFPDGSPERKDSVFKAFQNSNACLRFLRLCFGRNPYRSYFDQKTQKFVENLSHGRINSISQIDRVCRVAFPTSFTAFMTGYFLYYYNGNDWKKT